MGRSLYIAFASSGHGRSIRGNSENYAVVSAAYSLNPEDAKPRVFSAQGISSNPNEFITEDYFFSSATQNSLINNGHLVYLFFPILTKKCIERVKKKESPRDLHVLFDGEIERGIREVLEREAYKLGYTLRSIKSFKKSGVRIPYSSRNIPDYRLQSFRIPLSLSPFLTCAKRKQSDQIIKTTHLNLSAALTARYLFHLSLEELNQHPKRISASLEELSGLDRKLSAAISR